MSLIAGESEVKMRELTCYVARDLTLDAAQSARSSRGTVKTLPAAQIKKLLDSRSDRDVLDGLRKVTSVCLLTSITSV